MKGWWHYAAIGFLLGCIVCGGAVYLVSRSAGAKLNAELATVRTSLASALKINDGLASANRLANDQLANANRLSAEEQRTIAELQRTITGQRNIIDAAKRGLADLAESLASGLGDIRATAIAIKDTVGHLYAIYHPSPAGGQGS